MALAPDDIIPTASITLRFQQFQLHDIQRKPRVLIGRMDAATWHEFAQLCRDAVCISDAVPRASKYRQWEIFRVLAIIIMLAGLICGVLVLLGFLGDNLILSVLCFIQGVLGLIVCHYRLQKFREQFLDEAIKRLNVSLDALNSKYTGSIRFTPSRVTMNSAADSEQAVCPLLHSGRIGPHRLSLPIAEISRAILDEVIKRLNVSLDALNSKYTESIRFTPSRVAMNPDSEQAVCRSPLHCACSPHASVVLHVFIEMLVKSVQFNPAPLPPISYELGSDKVKVKIEQLEAINKQLSDHVTELQTAISQHKSSEAHSPRVQQAMGQQIALNHLPPQILVQNNQGQFAMIQFTPSSPDPAQNGHGPEDDRDESVTLQPGDINVIPSEMMQKLKHKTMTNLEKEGAAASLKKYQTVTFTNSDDDIYAAVLTDGNDQEENSNVMAALDGGICMLTPPKAAVLVRTQTDSDGNSEELYVEVQMKDTPTQDQEELETVCQDELEPAKPDEM
eukprot:CAMPEP_0197074762 /NCGR_PEP_ID=MMETSP1384-20130603/211270_1 /TAXON_ID=29189 /ORGANISM="Ammonia sp." /LENGTH=504 /DNA_ID=CAMNT_0042513603 /DNA_START=86 /DNA_END=1601 /DNA_ORIENTATION=-